MAGWFASQSAKCWNLVNSCVSVGFKRSLRRQQCSLGAASEQTWNHPDPRSPRMCFTDSSEANWARTALGILSAYSLGDARDFFARIAWNTVPSRVSGSRPLSSDDDALPKSLTSYGRRRVLPLVPTPPFNFDPVAEYSAHFPFSIAVFRPCFERQLNAFFVCHTKVRLLPKNGLYAGGCQMRLLSLLSAINWTLWAVHSSSGPCFVSAREGPSPLVLNTEANAVWPSCYQFPTASHMWPNSRLRSVNSFATYALSMPASRTIRKPIPRDLSWEYSATSFTWPLKKVRLNDCKHKGLISVLLRKTVF